MRISAITVSVDYSEYLAKSIPVWIQTCDDLLVVTSTTDDKTIELCTRTETPFVATDVFFANGAIFNKAAALDIGYAQLAPKDWVVCFDADIVPKSTWRENLPELSPGILYGAKRHHESGHEIHDAGAAGFFLMFHSTDTLALPGFGSWMSAASYDTDFVRRWHPTQRRCLPIKLRHLGVPGQNWCGIGKQDQMLAMFEERMKRGGWEHERLG